MQKITNHNYDKVMTSDIVAHHIVHQFNPSGTILEPCKGTGSFLKFLPNGTLWCEIDEGKDFFKFNEKVDWIITNPPYSLARDFMIHSFEISNNVVLLLPATKIFASGGKMFGINQYGGIKVIQFVKPKLCGFNFGWNVAIFHFQKDYRGMTQINYEFNKFEWLNQIGTMPFYRCNICNKVLRYK